MACCVWREEKLFSSRGGMKCQVLTSSRSPWSNEYDPPLGDGAVPSKPLRELELKANDTFDVYRDLYFEGGVSSVYTWDLDSGFAAVVLIKKSACSAAWKCAYVAMRWVDVLEVPRRGAWGRSVSADGMRHEAGTHSQRAHHTHTHSHAHTLSRTLSALRVTQSQ